MRAGAPNTLDTATGLDLSPDTWYEIAVQWRTTGRHVVSLYDSAGNLKGQVTATDSTWTEGGIGYNAHTENGATGYFDHVMISETSTPGRFETSLDWWDTTNSNQLGQVSRDEQLAPITEGDNALEVEINSDPEPITYNEEWIQRADVEGYPGVLADVLPASVENSASTVTFRFRYHHSDPGGVEESPEMTADQEHGGGLAWDMSGLDSAKLASPERLEVAWYPEDHPPPSDFEYNGLAYVDNV